IEERDRLARFRVAIAAARHPLPHVVGKQLEPVVKPPVIEEARFAIEELLDLADDVLVTHVLCSPEPPRPRRSASRPSSSPRSAAPSGDRTGGGCSRSYGTRWPSRRAPHRSGRARAPSAC